jgi:hypothetical protein
LGPDRFRIISGIVRDLCDAQGLTNKPAPVATGKKGSKGKRN